MLNFSPASENNKHAILVHLRNHLSDTQDLLEIGSGSGQHAIYFSQHFPSLIWQPSELAVCIPALAENVERYGSENVLAPVILDVCEHPWPISKTSAVFTANTLHIMPWNTVCRLFRGVADVLSHHGLLCIYGPFKYRGEFTTPSNAEFDQWLKHADPLSGIRDFEAVNTLALEQGLSLIKDYPMPANNQLLVFKAR